MAANLPPVQPITPQTAGGAPPKSGNWFTRMSPEAQGALIQAGASIGGGLLSGIGQDKQNQANLDFNYAQLRQQAADSAANRTLQAAQTNPLSTQAERQKMAVMGAILPGLRNASVTSNIPGMNSFIPQISGGLRLPEGGLPQNVLDFYSPQSMANAEGEFWKQMADSVAPQDLSKVGYGQAGVEPYQNALSAHQAAIQGALSPAGAAGQQGLSEGMVISKQQAQMIPPPKGYEWKDAGNGMVRLKKKGHGFWGTLGKIGAIAGGGIATALTAGAASPLLGAAIGAGTGAATGALSGGGWKGALTGAALGGVTGGVGAAAGGGAGAASGAASQGVGSTIGHALLDPQLISQMASQALPGRAGQVASVVGGLPPVIGIGGPIGGGAGFWNPHPVTWQDILAQVLHPSAQGGGDWMQVLDQILKMRQQPSPVLY